MDEPRMEIFPVVSQPPVDVVSLFRQFHGPSDTLESNHEQEGWSKKAFQDSSVFSPSLTQMAQAPRPVDGDAVLQHVLNDENALQDVQVLDPAPAGNQQENQAAIDVVGFFFLGFICFSCSVDVVSSFLSFFLSFHPP